MQEEFQNQQAYLENYFADDSIVTEAMLKDAKAKWRKIYNTRYQKRYRVDFIQITFRLPKDRYEKLVEKAGNTKPTKFCKALVLKTLLGQSATNIESLKIEVLRLIDEIEEAQYEDKLINADNLLSALNKMLEMIT